MKKLTAILLSVIFTFSAFGMTAFAQTPSDLVTQPANYVTVFRTIVNLFKSPSKHSPTGISIDSSLEYDKNTYTNYYLRDTSSIKVYVTSKNGSNKLSGQNYSFSIYKLDDKGNINGSAISTGKSSSNTAANDKINAIKNDGKYALVVKAENGGYMSSLSFKYANEKIAYVEPEKPETPETPTYHAYIFQLYVNPDVPLDKYGEVRNDRDNNVVTYAFRYIFKNPAHQYLGAKMPDMPNTEITAPQAPEIEGYTFLGWIETSSSYDEAPHKLIKAGQELPFEAVVDNRYYGYDYYSLYVNNKTHIAYSKYCPEGFEPIDLVIPEDDPYYINHMPAAYYNFDENGEYIINKDTERYSKSRATWMGRYILTDEWLQNWLGYIPS